MSTQLNYEHTFAVESLNEFSNSVYATIARYLTKNELDENDVKNKDNLHVKMYWQLREMRKINLFKLSIEEIKELEEYWKMIDPYVEHITEDKELIKYA